MKKRGQKSHWDTVIEPRLKEIEAWSRDGLTNQQMADNLGTSLATFQKYKSLMPEMAETLKIGKNIADMEVENALRKRALGYEYVEETKEGFANPDGVLTRYRTKRTTKIVVPDVTAQIFWLKNRQPEKWRDRKQTQITGSNDGPIRIAPENVIQPDIEPTEAARKYAAMLEDV